MSQRLRELLIKAVRQLDRAEQDEVLGELLVAGGIPWATASIDPLGRQATGVLRSVPPGFGPAAGRSLDRSDITDRISALLGGSTGEGGDLRMLPIRLPNADYERLRAWSKEHGFSMAVIIRTLVERFLDGPHGGKPAPPAAT